MPSVLLTGGRTRTSRTRTKKVRIPKLPRGRRRRAAPVILPTTATATASERAALQNLATRLQRGDVTAWRTASSAAANEAARVAAATGRPATATDLLTGATANAVPLSGTGAARRRRTRRSATASSSRRRTLKGGFLPALIPIIAAAIGAIPGIAGTAVGIASLAEQKRQFNKMYGDRK